MKVEKEALGGQRVEPTEEELALVNRQSRKELTAAEVYPVSYTHLTLPTT